jgi:hypothetical protein
MLLRISDVFFKPAKEGHTVVIIMNEITHTGVLWNRMLFDAKNAVVNSICYVTRIHLQPFLWLTERNVKKKKDFVDFGITHFACAGNIIYLSKKHQLSQACRDVSKRSFLAEVLSCISSISPLPASLMRCLSGYGIVSSQTLPGQEQSNWMTLTVKVSVSQYSVVKVIVSNKCYFY